MDKLSIKTLNLKFTLNEKIELENICFKGKEVISKISLLDKFYEELEDLSNNNSFITVIKDILKDINWKIDQKVKRKEIIVFANGVSGKNTNNEVNLNVVITASDSSIVISHNSYSQQKCFFRISSLVELKESKIIAPYSLPEDGKLFLSIEDIVKVENKNGVAHLLSSLPSTTIGKDNVLYAPIVKGRTRDIYKAWLSKKNNKNQSVIKIILSNE